MPETILSSRRIYSGRIFNLDECEVQLADGGHASRQVIRHPGAAAIVAVDSQQRILLVRQYRVASDQILTELPAGILEKGEDPEQCAIRELQEETGFKPGKTELLGGFYTAPGYTEEFIHIYLATDLTESRLPADEGEHIEVTPIPLSEGLAMIERGEITDAKTIIGLLRYAGRPSSS